MNLFDLLNLEYVLPLNFMNVTIWRFLMQLKIFLQVWETLDVFLVQFKVIGFDVCKNKKIVNLSYENSWISFHICISVASVYTHSKLLQCDVWETNL